MNELRYWLRSGFDGRVRLWLKVWTILATAVEELDYRWRRRPEEFREGERRLRLAPARNEEEAFLRWTLAQMTSEERRRYRRHMDRLADKYGYARYAFASVAAPHIGANDGSVLGDLATKQWLGQLIASAGRPWYDSGNPVYGGGVVGNNSVDDTFALGAAMTSCQGSTYGGVILLPPGKPVISGQLPTISGHNVSLWGPGSVACVIQFSGAGDMFRLTHQADSAASSSGVFRGFGVDMTNAGAAAAAFHVGDFSGLGFEEISIRNAPNGGSGFWFDNQVFWTERTTMYRVDVAFLGKSFRYTLNGGSTSFGYHRYLDVRGLVQAAETLFSVEGGNLYNNITNLICNVAGDATTIIWNCAGGTVSGTGAQNLEQSAGGGSIFLQTLNTGAAQFTWTFSTITYGALVLSVTRNTLKDTDGAAGAYTVQAGVSGALAVDGAAFSRCLFKLTGNVTSVTINNLPLGGEIELGFSQGVGAPWTLPAIANWTSWGAQIKFAGGALPVFSGTNTWKDYLHFLQDTDACVELSRSIGVR